MKRLLSVCVCVCVGGCGCGCVSKLNQYKYKFAENYIEHWIKRKEGVRAICNSIDGVNSNLVYEFQPIASEILRQLSRYKGTESNLLADEKDHYHLGKGVGLIIYLFIEP